MAISADLYRTFYGVGLYLSFSKAARELGVSQSAISQGVKQLEKELGMPLFHRTTKSVMFTPEGKELFDTVGKALTLLDNGVEQLQERMRQQYENLSLATTDTLCRHYLLPYFRRWKESQNDIALHITNRPSSECIDMVMNKEAQLAIVTDYEGLADNPLLEVTPIATGQDIFVGGLQYKGLEKFDQGRLLNEPILALRRGTTSRTFFDEITHGACRKPRFELDNFDLLVDLVEIDMGIALVPQMVAATKLQEGTIVKIDTDIQVPERTIVLVQSRMVPQTEGMRQFVDLLLGRETIDRKEDIQ
ncbi:MAG: LysR family transcriptional regulator [Veillonella sp.]|nr:LysR family transcriptional regulator [Veillonella sp.]